jgi:hypothetical protein
MNKLEKIQKDFEYCQQYMNLIKQDYESYSNTFYHYINNFCNQAEIKKVYEIISEIYTTIYITYDFIDFKKNLLKIYDDYITVVNAYINTLQKHTKIDIEYDKLLYYYYIYCMYARYIFFFSFEGYSYNFYLNKVRIIYLLDIFLYLKNKNIISIEEFNLCFCMGSRAGRNLFKENNYYLNDLKELYSIQENK